MALCRMLFQSTSGTHVAVTALELPWLSREKLTDQQRFPATASGKHLCDSRDSVWRLSRGFGPQASEKKNDGCKHISERVICSNSISIALHVKACWIIPACRRRPFSVPLRLSFGTNLT